MARVSAVARQPRPFDLTEEGRRELDTLVRTPSAPAGLRRRARLVLLIADATSGIEVARRLGYTVVHVSRLRRRVIEEGIAGIYDGPRPGRPTIVSARKAGRSWLSLCESQSPALVTGAPARSAAVQVSLI